MNRPWVPIVGFRRGFILGNYFALPIFAFVVGVLAAQGKMHPLVALFIALCSGVVLVSGVMLLQDQVLDARRKWLDQAKRTAEYRAKFLFEEPQMSQETNLSKGDE